MHLRAHYDGKHPVSGALRPIPSAEETPHPDYDLDGRIPRRNVGPFMRLLVWFTHADFTPTDWNAATAHVRGTSEDDLAMWDAHPVEGTTASLLVRIANVACDDDLVDVVVTGATDDKLRLRIDTLLEALRPDV